MNKVRDKSVAEFSSRRRELFMTILISTCHVAMSSIPCFGASEDPATSPPAAEAGEGLDEIVVTASRRKESAHDLPAAVSALSGSDLKDIGALSSTDVAAMVPNVEFHSEWGFSDPQYYIRGLGNRNFQTNAASPVAVYTDGVVMGSSLTQSFQALDLERVEVLRGPQGTLYGRNASAGLLNFISVQPDPKTGYSGYADLGYGSFNELTGDAALNIPLTDTVAARAAVAYRQRDGFFKDGGSGADLNGEPHVYPSLGRDVGREQSLQYRFTVGYFGDDLEVKVRARGGFIDNDQRPFKQIGELGPSPYCPHLGLNQICHDSYGFSDSSDPFQTFLSFIGYEKGNANGADLSVKYLIEPSVALYYTGGYDQASNHRFVDEDFSPFDEADSTYDTTVWFTSHELRLQSENAGIFNWILGAYYYEEGLHQWYGSVDPLYGISGFGSPLNQHTKSAASFANAKWDFAEHFSLRGGVRVTYDQRRGDSQSLYWNGTNYLTTPGHEGTAESLLTSVIYPDYALEKSWTKPSGEVTLSYKPSTDWHVYLGYSIGFKSGDYNGGLFSKEQSVITNPEYVHNLEFGIKGRALDGKLNGDLTFFRMNVLDQQVQSIQIVGGLPATLLSNAGSSKLQGIELNLNYRIYHGQFGKFSLQGSLGLLDARFTTYPNAPGGFNWTGNTLAYAPKRTANLGPRYELETSVGTFETQASWRYTSMMFDQPSDYWEYVIKPYWFADAYLAFKPISIPQLNVKVLVKNITDRIYYTTYFNTGGSGYEGLGFADPRTVEVSMEYKF